MNWRLIPKEFLNPNFARKVKSKEHDTRFEFWGFPEVPPEFHMRHMCVKNSLHFAPPVEHSESPVRAVAGLAVETRKLVAGATHGDEI